jgi:hypothetical protein
MVAGDLWVDTGNGNKMHRYSGSSWVAVIDAITEGNGVSTNVSNQITTINCDGITIKSTASNALCTIDSSGITIQSSSSGNRIVMTASAITVYKTGTTVSTVIDTSGIMVRNNTSNSNPNTYERISFENSTPVETGAIFSSYTGNKLYINSTNSSISIGTSANSQGVIIGASGTDGYITLSGMVAVATGFNFTVYNGLCRANRYILTDGAGTDRASIYSGSGAPDGAVGAVGDLYIRTTGLFYQKTGASTWTQIS